MPRTPKLLAGNASVLTCRTATPHMKNIQGIGGPQRRLSICSYNGHDTERRLAKEVGLLALLLVEARSYLVTNIIPVRIPFSAKILSYTWCPLYVCYLQEKGWTQQTRFSLHPSKGHLTVAAVFLFSFNDCYYYYYS